MAKPSVSARMASERASVKPATHGEWFELHGWIQNQCCELSFMPVNHLKCTCSVVDKGIFPTHAEGNTNNTKKELSHLTVLASCVARAGR